MYLVFLFDVLLYFTTFYVCIKVHYNAQNGTCQLVAVGGYQSPTAFQPLSLVVPVGTPGGQSK